MSIWTLNPSSFREQQGTRDKGQGTRDGRNSEAEKRRSGELRITLYASRFTHHALCAIILRA
ncbi:MAG: hypothetical protein SQA66_05405 [Candidatus Fervidibacter sacchari]